MPLVYKSDVAIADSNIAKMVNQKYLNIFIWDVYGVCVKGVWEGNCRVATWTSQLPHAAITQ